ncbi:recombinase family protein [Phenylobacterium sp.]|jgi:DNA invertase Pin-like site-specific DNA recombinase|uniref:recombinase family protein n=1 Tax=Phenylobacterium sp. TaxID=1871053 RepID=UPI0037CA2D2C
MLSIGYVRRGEATADLDTAALMAAGCQVVRTEELQGHGQTLDSVLDFIGAGDELVACRLSQLARGGRELLHVLNRLEARGASLRVLDPELRSAGSDGRALRAALEAVATLEPPAGRRRRPTSTTEILALQRAGVGPVEIARRLGVSRMTVWRTLKALEAAEA